MDIFSSDEDLDFATAAETEAEQLQPTRHPRKVNSLH